MYRGEKHQCKASRSPNLGEQLVPMLPRGSVGGFCGGTAAPGVERFSTHTGTTGNSGAKSKQLQTWESPAARLSITFLSASNDVLIFAPSANRSPSASVLPRPGVGERAQSSRGGQPSPGSRHAVWRIAQPHLTELLGSCKIAEVELGEDRRVVGQRAANV